eukprot:6565650-Pyramimonas_sp.AAC.2
MAAPRGGRPPGAASNRFYGAPPPVHNVSLAEGARARVREGWGRTSKRSLAETNDGCARSAPLPTCTIVLPPPLPPKASRRPALARARTSHRRGPPPC